MYKASERERGKKCFFYGITVKKYKKAREKERANNRENQEEGIQRDKEGERKDVRI